VPVVVAPLESKRRLLFIIRPITKGNETTAISSPLRYDTGVEMPRPKKYERNTARQKAYRQRHQAAVEYLGVKMTRQQFKL
jgi:hypothetical protein